MGEGSMKMQYRHRAWLQFAVAILLGLGIPATVLGTTYARYQIGSSKAIQLQYANGAHQVHVRELENVEMLSTDTSEAEVLNRGRQTEDYTMEFMLSNGTAEDSFCPYDQRITLSLFATLGLDKPENVTITLTDGWSVYTAECRKVAEGTAWYTRYGPGWVYSFYNEAGEEISWHLTGTRWIEKKMTITVNGESEMPAALSLIANVVPCDI